MKEQIVGTLIQEMKINQVEKLTTNFFKKNIKLMLCIKVSITKWKTEVIIWTIKAQKCKSFCSIIEVFQGKVYLEFFFYVPSQLYFMNQRFFTQRPSEDFTQGLRVIKELQHRYRNTLNYILHIISQCCVSIIRNWGFILRL